MHNLNSCLLNLNAGLLGFFVLSSLLLLFLSACLYLVKLNVFSLFVFSATEFAFYFLLSSSPSFSNGDGSILSSVITDIM